MSLYNRRTNKDDGRLLRRTPPLTDLVADRSRVKTRRVADTNPRLGNTRLIRKLGNSVMENTVPVLGHQRARMRLLRR